MKKTLLFLTLTIFIFNSSISGVWASNFYCNKGQIQMEKSDMDNNIPCHAENQDAQNSCFEICSCVDISTNVNFDFKAADYSLDVSFVSDKFDIINDNILSKSFLPLNRPPISNS